MKRQKIFNYNSILIILEINFYALNIFDCKKNSVNIQNKIKP